MILEWMEECVSDRNYRKVRVGGDDPVLTAYGPTDCCPEVDLTFEQMYHVVTDADLVANFDRGMELGPWLDWAAELDPGVQPFADAYGRLLSEARPCT